MYVETVECFGAAIGRLARGYERDPETRRDLLQDIHLELWRSFAYFDERCSLRTWVYRVAHNTGTRHVVPQLDSQIILLYLEGVDAASTAEITGLSAAHIAMKGYIESSTC